LLEVSYVGNQSKYGLNQQGVGTNVNVIAAGTLLKIGKDPNVGSGEYTYGNYPIYQTISVANHNLSSNYNSLQVSWVRQKGSYDIAFNYTYSKSLGTLNANCCNALDQINPDYVFIDCPPSLGLLTVNAMVAAEEVFIPIQCEYYALEGLSQLLSNIELVQAHLNQNLWVSTILLTMYDGRTKLADQVADEVRRYFGTKVLRSVIPRSVTLFAAPVAVLSHRLWVRRFHSDTRILGRPVTVGGVPMEVGARNAAAPPWEGRMVPFGSPFAPIGDVRATNDHIQQVLSAVRPFGATPINGLLNDARTFFRDDGDFRLGGCRERQYPVVAPCELTLIFRRDLGGIAVVVRPSAL